MQDIAGLIFDKDGTLFDFHATWGPWAQAFLEDVAEGDRDEAARLGRAIGYDYARGCFARNSVVIAGTPEEVGAALEPLLGVDQAAWLIERINAEAARAPMAEAVPLVPLLQGLRGHGLRLGVATNDAEAPARAHLGAAGVTGLFDFIVGSDSGYGAKPEPGMLLGFADALDLPPARVAMIGDSTHDLLAGRAAGMATVAVLTGMAEAADLAPHADVVLPDIGHLPGWLGL